MKEHAIAHPIAQVKYVFRNIFVCDAPKPPLDICETCPINGLREPSTIVITSYMKPGELEDIEEENN